MARSTSGVVTVGVSLALTACGGSDKRDTTITNSTPASAELTSSSTSAAPTSPVGTTATSEAPTPTRSMTASPKSALPGDSTSTGSGTDSAASTSTAIPTRSGALDTAIRHHSFANVTFMTAAVGAGRLHGGVAAVNPAGDEPAHVGLQGTSQAIGETRGSYYGGIEDVVLQLNVIQGNGVSSRNTPPGWAPRRGWRVSSASRSSR